ncbi:MAG: hypothetical protein U1F33_08155 [Alphaproteobacteria bacterium]
MNKVYPVGSTVFCATLEDFDADLESGDRVVCFLRARDGKDRFELGELKITEAGRAWLISRSDHPDYQEPVRFAWPLDAGATAITERGVYKIIAVVTASYRKEPAGIRAAEEVQLRWREHVENREHLDPAVLKRWLVEGHTLSQEKLTDSP